MTKRRKAHGHTHTLVWILASARLWVTPAAKVPYDIPNIEWCSTCGALLVNDRTYEVALPRPRKKVKRG